MQRLVAKVVTWAVAERFISIDECSDRIVMTRIPIKNLKSEKRGERIGGREIAQDI